MQKLYLTTLIKILKVFWRVIYCNRFFLNLFSITYFYFIYNDNTLHLVDHTLIGVLK